MVYQYDASIIGGDLRQNYLASILEQSGYKIISFGLYTDIPAYKLNRSDTLKQVMESSKTIIAPIPFSMDKININTTKDVPILNKTDLSIDNFFRYLKPHHCLIGGSFPYEVTEYCIKEGINCLDLMNYENITLLNAIATAEGAIAEAINKSVINIHQSNCLVLGYGRCGKLLSSKLHAFGAKVTVSARKKEALAEAYTNGCECMNLDDLDIQDFDFIFNTIPSLILSKELLFFISSDTSIIDIASAPGGVDYEYAKEHNLNVYLCLGIPGKISPKSSAEILAEAILPILKERGD